MPGPNVLIENLSGYVTDGGEVARDVTTLRVIDGRFAFHDDAHSASYDVVIDAQGTIAVPTLVDAHTHPVIGGYNPKQGLYDFAAEYFKGGVGTLVSAGVVHVPGAHEQSALLAISVAATSALAFGQVSAPDAPRVDGRCLCATRDMTPEHLDTAHAAGVRRLKFLYETSEEQRRQLTEHAHRLGWLVLLHCGGSSVPGSRPLSFEQVVDFGPDVLAHLNGGTTSLPWDDCLRLTHETSCVIDLVKCGNPARAVALARVIEESGYWDRVVLGTDSPTGSGMVPTGLWYLMCLLSSMGGIAPARLIAAASSRPAGVYLDEPHGIADGNAGSLLLIDAPRGGQGPDAIASISNGDIPGIAAMIVDGHLVRTQGFHTPPAERTVGVSYGGSGAG